MTIAPRFAAFLMAVAMTAVSGAAQSGGTQAARPSLPYQVRLELRESQTTVARAIAAPQTIALWAPVIDAATRVANARTTHQGPDWWETVDARLQLADVRKLSELAPETRQALGAVYEQLASIDARRAELLASRDAAGLAAAIGQLARAGETLASAVGAEHRSVARVKRRIAALEVARGQPQSGERAYGEARDVLKRSVGTGHPEYASVLQELGVLYVASGRLSDAEPVLVEALKIRRNTVREGEKPEQMAYADTVMWLGVLSAGLDRLADAEKRFLEAADAYERIAESEAYATAQIRLADVYASMGKTDEAKARYATARRWQPKSAPVLLGHATFLLSVGDLDGAQTTCDEGLELLGADDRRGLVYAQALDVLAGIDRARARFPDAETRYSQALDLQVATLGASHPDALTTISKRASVRTLMGAYAQAEADYRRVLQGFEATLGTANLSYGVTLNELAVLYQYKKPKPDYAQALEYYGKARDIFEVVVGTGHTAYITALHNLGAVHHALADTGDSSEREGHQAEAERLYAETRALLKDRAATQRALYATVLDNSARLSASRHRVDEATTFANEASRVRLELYGRDHPAFAASLSTQALILVEGKHLPEAASLLLQSTRSEWAHVTRSLPALTDDQKRLFLQQTEFTQADRLWTLVFEQAQSAAEGLDAVLLRKHLLFEATRQESGAFRAVVASAPPEWQQRWAERNTLRQRYAEGVLHGAPDDVVRQLSVSLEALEASLRRENPAYDRQARLEQITIDDLLKTLRPSDAIVEIVAYRKFDFGAGSFDAQKTYGALVVRAGAAPVAVRLGPVPAIDALVGEYRGEMRKWIRLYEDARGEVSQARASGSERALTNVAEALATEIWTPIANRLAGTTRVYLAPDGELALFPFEALVTPGGAGVTYLGEKTEFVYLSASRDLGRFRLTASSPAAANTAVIVGHPDFNMPAPAGQTAATTERSTRCHYNADPWPDAPGLTPFVISAQQVLTTLKWNITSLVDRDAIEGAVMAVRAPRLLQFATHGYFLDCGEDGALETPLAQSLLILAGANHPRPSGTPVGDGILTAYEVTGMNLDGTELVNLTACQTGVGAVTPDGVAGLRQAFLWAGARSLTMSMWEVPVTEVTAQIKTFYSRWLDVPAGQTGPSRYEAFRASQIAALAAAREKWNSAHPFFWASTVFVGDPGDLPGTRGGSAS